MVEIIEKHPFVVSQQAHHALEFLFESEKEIDNLKELIDGLRTFGVGILLVEHNVKMVTETCQRILVLNFGRLIAEGTPDEVLKDKDVIKAYLGK